LRLPRLPATAAYERGRDGEDYVANLLASEGWTVAARNFRAAGGELDVVAHRDGVWRFVEVKSRSPDDPSGVEAIGPDKRRRLRAAAESWLSTRGLPEREAAFLVAVVSFEPSGWTVDWWDDAF
jgi:putative endonuclease